MGHGADLITELGAVNRLVELLFDQIERQRDPLLREELVERAAAQLLVNSLLEQQYLYPAVRDHVPGGAAIAARETADHGAMEQTLGQLAKLRPEGARFARLVEALISDGRAHIQDEEHSLFPALQAVVTWEVLEDLGEKVRCAKRSATPAPTVFRAVPPPTPADRLRDARSD